MSKLNYWMVLLFTFHLSVAQEPSSIVFDDSDGCLRYVADQNDNRIIDFSYAGYKNGEAEIPTISTVVRVTPISGDNTAYLQNIIDSISNLSPDANGYRGAILLEAGNYEIQGTLRIQASGVVLRGVGDDDDASSNTILRGVGNVPNQRNIIEAGGLGAADWTARAAGSSSPITSTFVPAGSRTIEVGVPELFNVGDEVIILHPDTEAWLASINFGDTDTDDPWSVGEINIFYKRTITAVNIPSGKITLDVPIYDHFERVLSTAEIYRLAETDIKNNIGIENLRVVIETNGELTEDHARNAIFLRGVEDCWVTDVTGLHFIYAAVDMTVASRVTVKNCRGLEPHSLIDGARRYNFAVGRRSNNILFTECLASEGRHSFVSNGTSSVSGIVWHNSTSTRDYSVTEGHRRWSQALLFDNITFTNPNTNRLVGLYNRGRFGTGHGWSTVHGVAWNIKMPSTNTSVIQRPPGRQNYAIACQGIVTGQGPFSHPTGYIEDSGETPLINSLYEKQLENRLANGAPTDAPARFKVEKNNDEINITWLDIADDETGYVIEISNDDENYNELVEVPANETSYTFPISQIAGELVYFRMYAKSSNCPSAYTYSALLDFSVNTREPVFLDISISPNPASHVLNIYTNGKQIDEVQVFGLDGKSRATDFLNQELNTASLGKGIYLLKITLVSGESAFYKFAKM